MLVFAGYLVGKVLDGLVRVHGTVEHIQFLLQDCKVSAIGTVLDVQDGVRVVFDLLDHTGVLDVENSQHSWLETSGEEQTCGIWGQAEAVIIGRVTELIGLFKFFGIPESDGEVAAERNDAVGEVVIDYLCHIFSVRPDDGSIIIIGEVQNGENSCWCSACNLRCFFGEGQAGDNSIVVCLKDIFTEIHLPHSQQLVLPARHAETGTDHQAADGCIVVQFIDLLELVSSVVYLEKEAVLTAHVYALYLWSLLQGVGVVVGILEIQNSEDGVSGMMVEHDWRARKMLVFHSPKPDVFLTARDQFIGLYWAELDGEDVEVADLLCQQFGLFIGLYFADVEDEDGLPLVGVQSDHSQMFLIAEPDLLHFFVGALEAGNAFMVYPYSHWGFGSLLDGDDPVVVAVHGNDVVSMSLHEQLLACYDIFPNEDAAGWIVHFVDFEDEVWVVEWAEGKSGGEL